MQQHNRRFGTDIQNIAANNHIVLKSRSFSFQNKNKVYMHQAPALRNQMVRRQAINLYNPNSYLMVDRNASQNRTQSTIIVQKPAQIQDSINQSIVQLVGKDIQLVPQYLRQCIQYMKKRQTNKIINIEDIKSRNPDYLRRRQQLINQIIQIHKQLKLFPQTLFVAVRYMDEYSSKIAILQKQFKIIGLVCLLIAGKFQESYNIPSIKKILQTSRSRSKREQLINMQQKIMDALDFQLVVETPVKYLQFFSKITNLSRKNQCICQYATELTLLNTKSLQFQPSLISCSAIYMIHKVKKLSFVWSKAYKQLTGYDQSDLTACIKYLCELLNRPQQIQNGCIVKKKYATAEYCWASNVKLQRRSQ